MKLDCADYELLSAYVDGELAVAEMQRVEAHLVACATCAARTDELRQLRSLFVPLREEWAPINVVDAVNARLNSDISCGWGWGKFAVIPIVLLSFGALLLGVKLGTQLTAPREPPAAASVRLAPFAAIPPGNLCVGPASCDVEGNI